MTRPAAAIPLYVRCDAGREDGLGHLSRCLSLADALHAANTAPATFVTHAPEDVGAAAITTRGHEYLAAADHAGSDEDLRFMTGLLHDARQRHGAKPLLVLDSRRIDSDYARHCGDHTVVACFDDEALRDLACDILINSNVWVSAESYPARNGRRVVAGPAYNLIREAFFDTPQRRADVSKPLRVLITLGGEDPQNHTRWIVETLSDLLRDHAVTIIVGPAHPDPASVRLAADRHLPEAEIVSDPAAMAPYLTAAEVAITAGGTTCYELAAARVAQAAIVIEDHQQALVDALATQGCLVPIGRYDKLDTAQARRSVARLLASPEERATMAAAAAALFPRSGLATVADAILETYGRCH